MELNLNWIQIALIILGIIILLLIINWATKPTVVVQPFTQQEDYHHLSNHQPMFDDLAGLMPPMAPPPHGYHPAPPPKNAVSGSGSAILYYFYNPRCGHCSRFTATWNDFTNQLQNVPGLIIRSVDVTRPENKDLASHYDAKATPTILLVTPNNQIVKFQGARTLDNLRKFVQSHLASTR